MMLSGYIYCGSHKFHKDKIPKKKKKKGRNDIFHFLKPGQTG